MGPALRRSSRSTPKRTSSYNVGDVVEIVRGNLTLIGRLSYKLTEGTSPNPRWLVTFEDPSQKDEELYEKDFGKVLVPAAEEPEKPAAPSSRRVRSSGSSSSNSNVSSVPKKIASSEEGDTEGEKKKTKSVTFSDMETPAQSDDSSSQDKNVSAREKRSLRRQAKIEDEVPVSGPNVTGIAANINNNKKRLPVKGIGGNGKRIKTEINGEEVVKVKMLTGTLYLYRGLNRRAEFVRRF